MKSEYKRASCAIVLEQIGGQYWPEDEKWHLPADWREQGRAYYVATCSDIAAKMRAFAAANSTSDVAAEALAAAAQMEAINSLYGKLIDIQPLVVGKYFGARVFRSQQPSYTTSSYLSWELQMEHAQEIQATCQRLTWFENPAERAKIALRYGTLRDQMHATVFDGVECLELSNQAKGAD